MNDNRTMRYERPALVKENIEVSDVIQASHNVVIKTVQKEIKDPVTNETISVTATQVTFDFSDLFR